MFSRTKKNNNKGKKITLKKKKSNIFKNKL